MTNSYSETPRLTVGLDVSDRFTSFCLLDEQGQILEEGKVPTTPQAFTRRFRATEACRVVMEVGTHSRWASQLLADVGHEVIVANPWKVRLISDSIKKTDRSDAETLARLGRVDPKLLSPVTHRPIQAHADLEVIHARQSLIASRSLLINHVRGAVKPFGHRLCHRLSPCDNAKPSTGTTFCYLKLPQFDSRSKCHIGRSNYFTIAL